MQQRRTGVFGTVKEDDNQQNVDYLKPVSQDNPDTIYNLLFKEYNEEIPK